MALVSANWKFVACFVLVLNVGCRQFEVVVTDEKGSPVEGVLVLGHSPPFFLSAETNSAAITNSKGVAEVCGGQNHVSLFKEGFRPRTTWEHRVELKPGISDKRALYKELWYSDVLLFRTLPAVYLGPLDGAAAEELIERYLKHAEPVLGMEECNSIRKIRSRQFPDSPP